MKIIPLLRQDRTRLYDANLITDLQLEGLLSEKTLTVLRTPCLPPAAETITQRQAFFFCMNDAEFLSRLDAFESALFQLSKQLEVYQATRVSFTRLCLRFQLLRSYLTVCKELDALNGSTALFSQAAEALLDDAHRSLLSDMETDLDRAGELLQAMAHSILLVTDSASFARTAWLLRDNEIPSFRQQLTALAAEMGIEMGEFLPRTQKIDEAMGEAYTALYSDEVAELRTLAFRYEGLDLSAPLVWQDELSFFREIHALAGKAKNRGIPTCFPRVSSEKCYRALNAYNLTLMGKDCPKIVPNDIEFTLETPFFFLTGANGGGKTTYLRTVGANLLFFLSGCPIFAESAEIFPFSGLFSEFPEDESFSGMGRLDAEKLRVDRILASADENAFILFNETFSATDEEKGLSLVLSTVDDLQKQGIFGLFVTHFPKVMNRQYPILSAVVEEDEEHRRTFKIRRLDGMHSSYAKDILRKYKLDSASLAERSAK